ncbi:adenylosuccinate synthetase [bacterium NHP-B]|nr:adenylosuccinate synthetase [bacterium NHP-B]
MCSFHLELDRAQEESAKKDSIGTTRKGIGPGYVDLSSRLGLRCGDLLEDQGTLTNKVRKVVAWHNVWRKNYGLTPLSVADIMQELNTLRPLIARYGQDGVSQRLTTACAEGKKVLLEGAQGVLLDLTWGHPPFVTSCSTGAAAASLGTGVPPHALRHVWAVAKAYATRVGEGPFLTEMLEEDGRTTKLHQLIRQKGGEYGATTGRPRRVGYLDLVALKEAVQRHGVNGLVLTKIDVLDGVDKIPVCVGYRDPDTHRVVTYIPASLAAYKRLKPIYKTLDGWRAPTHNLQSFDALPPEAQAFVKFIEDFCGQKVRMVKTGPTREACIMITHPWQHEKGKEMRA